MGGIDRASIARQSMAIRDEAKALMPFEGTGPHK
jgi:hypothetical protein